MDKQILDLLQQAKRIEDIIQKLNVEFEQATYNRKIEIRLAHGEWRSEQRKLIQQIFPLIEG